MTANDKGWVEWSKHVLSELERLSRVAEDLRTDVAQIKTEIAMLKVKSGIWGLLGGLIPVIVMMGIRLF